MIKTIIRILCCTTFSCQCFGLPKGFVYLADEAPSIIQEIRYAGSHNFVGRPVQGYRKPVCILSINAAKRLATIQKKLIKKGYSLKVYDCYRPQQAVNDFYQWSKNASLTHMKKEFYPRENKANLFKKGYIARYSGHSRGSTVDITLVNLRSAKQSPYQQGHVLTSCIAPYKKRLYDNSIDMGTSYDCLDPKANVFNKTIGKAQRYNRYMLRKIMMSHGFYPYTKEWWHFTLRNEPFRRNYFNFPVS